MKRIQKALSLLLLLALALSLAACGGDAAPTAANTAPPADSPAGSGAAPADISTQSAQEQGYRAWDLQAPMALGRPKALALSGSTLYAAGQKTLYALDLESKAWRKLAYAPADSDMNVCALAVSGDTLAVFSGGYHVDETTWAFSMNFSMDLYDLETEELSTSLPLEGPEGMDFQHFFLLGDVIIAQSFDGVCTGSVADGRLSLLETERQPETLSVVNGQLLACAASPNGDGGSLYTLDAATGAMEELCSLEDIAGYSYVSAAGALLVSEASVSLIDTETGEPQPLFDWADTGVAAGSGPDSLLYDGEGTFYFCDLYSAAIYRVSPYEGPKRKELSLGSISGAGVYISQAVSLFNTTNDEYIVKLERYNPEDIDKVLTAINTGKGPDVLYLGSSTDRENAFNRVSVSSGMLEDLTPYLDADPDVSREDFLPGLLEAMEEKGGLYRLIPCFSTYTVTAPADMASELADWTVDKLLELEDNLPEGYTLTGQYRRDFFMEDFCEYASIAYVDYDSGTCSFDDPSFARWLELAATTSYGSDAKWGQAGPDGSMLNIGHTSLWQSSRFRETYGDYAYVGFPGPEGPVSFYHSPTGGFSILASSENKDAAWEFIKVLFSPRVQQGTIGGFGSPVMKESFDALMEDYLSRDNTDFTQEDVDRLKAAAAEGVGFSRGTTVSDIIMEEAAKYFAGQNSLQNAVNNIQSRAGIYLAEQA